MAKLLNAVVVVCLLMPGVCLASPLPDAPLPEAVSPAWSSDWSNYLTGANRALIALDAVAKSADELFTMRNAGRMGFEEHDPLARPFVSHGRAIAGVSQGLLFAGEIFTSYELHRHGHAKLAKAVLLLGIGGNTTGIATSDR
jgi:hypothetical protein